MKERKKLTIQMTIFTFLIFVIFGIIITKEKLSPYFSERIHKKFNEYIKINYSPIMDELKIGNTNYKNTKYELKITSKKNKNLYFYLYYSNKKITDTYKKDYLEGKTLLNKISLDLEENLTKKYNQKFNTNIILPLNEFDTNTKQKILKEDIASIPIYTLQTEINSNIEPEKIIEKIQTLHNTLQKNNIIPKDYDIIIKDTNNQNNTIKFNNLTKETIENKTTLLSIVNNEINNKNIFN